MSISTNSTALEMSYKNYISTTYDSSVYKKITKLKDLKMRAAAAKNQKIFLDRCISNSVFPKFVQVKSPVRTKQGHNITREYRKKLLIAAKNESSKRFHFVTRTIIDLTRTLKEDLNEKDYDDMMQFTDIL